MDRACQRFCSCHQQRERRRRRHINQCLSRTQRRVAQKLGCTRRRPTSQLRRRRGAADSSRGGAVAGATAASAGVGHGSAEIGGFLVSCGEVAWARRSSRRRRPTMTATQGVQGLRRAKHQRSAFLRATALSHRHLRPGGRGRRASRSAPVWAPP
jgi:hypothetical protein